MAEQHQNAQKQLTKESTFLALTKLMKRKPFDEITVTQITKLAGVSRMAFYRNYETKEDILADYLRDTLAEFRAGLKEQKVATKREIAYHYFVLFKENKDFIELLIKSKMTYVLHDALGEYFELNSYESLGSLEKTRQKYLLTCIRGVLYSIAIEWIRSGMRESVEEMSEVFFEILFHEK